MVAEWLDYIKINLLHIDIEGNKMCLKRCNQNVVHNSE